uniref:G-protein coupled receptors family 1 profile domain-containing protein n=1 Tax=Setaria digitata TaxID=48799 RepID=A0A915Q6L8_9BILA
MIADDDQPPEPIVSDYVELGTLLILFIIGGPLNLAAYTQIAERPSATRLDILKRHLNYSDLLVLFIYVPSRVCWLLTYDWRGGNSLCKIIKFLHTFSFQVSSNVIVCIAIDRLLSVVSSKHHSPEKAQRRTRAMLLIAWIAAALISTPQFIVWKTFLAFEELNWSQCMQNSTIGISRQLMEQENIYVVVHMMLIFWFPATIVLLCYLIVSCWVYLNSRPVTNTGMQLRNSTRPAISGNESSRQWIKSKHFNVNPCIIISEDDQATSSRSLTKQSSTVALDYSSTCCVVSYQSCNSKIIRSRAIRVSFQLVAAYIICWLPYNGLSLYHFIDPQGFFEAHANKVCRDSGKPEMRMIKQI